MAFVQIIECRTKQFDKIQGLEDEWRAATEGKRTLRRSIVLRDRVDQERHLILAFFDSYEAAMENSESARRHPDSVKSRRLSSTAQRRFRTLT